ncbi:ROK family protein [Leifsonia shinshuensis]|uniref:ROK family protein n=1 Tax=Leifsonia shinshuensis TaxID=150026 RepID=UPI0021566C41|nr:ROK family protein [Leifsonia shinshuensis]
MTSASTPSVPGIGGGAAVLAFDVGGTDIKAAIFDGDGVAHGLRRTATPRAGADTPMALAQRLASLSAELRAAAPAVIPVAAGVLVPGIVDADRGIAVTSANLGWRNAPIKKLMGSTLGIPVGFDHDVHAAGLAEHRLGAARGYDDVVVLVIGTGISGSLVLGGRVHRAGGFAGEIGHSPVADGPACSCGASGCLEAVASAGAIVRSYAQLSGDAGVLGASDVLDRVRLGDPHAVQVWETALDALALSLTQLTAFLAPRAIVIGGGLSRAGADLFGPLRSRVDARLSFHHRPAIVPAQLQGNAGLLGAGLIARDSLPAHARAHAAPPWSHG